MKFRNPWIDPRILQVRSANARGYLLRRGWKQASPESASLQHFEKAPESGSTSVVSVPTNDQARDYTQRIIEMITDLALVEDRYAVEVLNEILQHTSAEPPSANGPSIPLPAEPAPK